VKNTVKDFYRSYHDSIDQKRFHSSFPIRRQVHREIYESILKFVRPGETILDSGTGEGNLSILMAKAGAVVTGVDISAPNVAAAKKIVQEEFKEVGQRPHFQEGDAEALPFPDGSFDCVVSNHVLEHLPDFDKGLREIYRVTKCRAIVAVPTCLNFSSWSLLGGSPYYHFSKRSLFALPWGATRVLGAFVTGKEGVNEGYAGKKENIHIFRFPWVLIRKIREVGFEIETFEAQTIRPPYLQLPFNTQHLHRILRYFGLGTVFVLRKKR
jgi:ubiquinone/menaquinone biosynthesis C-methylase UbiE